MSNLDIDVVYEAMKPALRRAAIADPAAAYELALDLSEISFLSESGDRTAAKSARIRAGRTMVELRRRFNSSVPGLSKTPEHVDGEYFKPFIGETGERQYLVNEVGFRFCSWITCTIQTANTKTARSRSGLSNLDNGCMIFVMNV
jgi:hypothetical protein